MTHVAENVTFQVGEAQVTLPAKSVMRAWLDSLVTGAEPAAKQSTSTPRIGEIWAGQGGVYAGVMRGENGQTDYHLIVPTHPDASVEEIAWGSADHDETGAKSEFDGWANTEALSCSRHAHPAAQWARSLSIDGHSDFYLPARRELSLMYANVPELFEKAWHWSSTQSASNSGFAWNQTFGDGGQTITRKSSEYRARAVRRLVP
ncbi:DUF1566 domain-containing protein [Cupriavidus basilensis]|uniref:DUF1566 domain-containing protein n=1 Tax=Cupriavidus basilensis TaxID=68895 RepID=UPI0005BC5C38|nr:DUF1566 domain-containing protein [Cupriavidus basilensis]